MQPFFRWAGGKRSLAPQVLPHLPDPSQGLQSLFLGGGAVELALLASGRVRGPVRLADANPHLIAAWKGAQAAPAAMARAMRDLVGRDYYEVRDGEVPADPILTGARFLYLNYCAFSGLWRENKAGRMNVPSQKRPYQPEGQIEAVQAVSPLLAGVVIECAEYSAAQPMPGLLYADPPYLGTWAGYRSGWGPGHTAQVARLAREHGHSAVHDTDAAKVIHEGADTVEFAHVYRVGKSKRGTSKEVLYVYES